MDQEIYTSFILVQKGYRVELEYDGADGYTVHGFFNTAAWRDCPSSMELPGEQENREHCGVEETNLEYKINWLIDWLARVKMIGSFQLSKWNIPSIMKSIKGLAR